MQTFGPSGIAVGSAVAFYVGLAIVLGAAVTGAWTLRDDDRPAVRVALAIGWTLAAIGAMSIAIDKWSRIGDLGVFLRTPVGRGSLVRIVGLLVAHEGLLLAIWGAARARRAGFALAGAGAAVAAIGHAMSSHAALGSSAWLKVFVQGMHIVAAGVWIGGLAVLLIAIRGRSDDPASFAVRRFSAVAAVGIVAVVASGAMRSIVEIGGLRPLVETTYGRFALAKIQLLLLLAAFGAINRYRHVPKGPAGFGSLRRFGAGEIGVALVVFAMTGIMSGTMPAREAYARAQEYPVVAVEVLELPDSPRLYEAKLRGGSTVKVYLEPDAPGASEMHVTFFGADGKELPVHSLRMRATMGFVEEPRRFSDGHFVVGVRFDPGRPKLQISATTASGTIRFSFALVVG